MNLTKYNKLLFRIFSTLDIVKTTKVNVCTNIRSRVNRSTRKSKVYNPFINLFPIHKPFYQRTTYKTLLSPHHHYSPQLVASRTPTYNVCIFTYPPNNLHIPITNMTCICNNIDLLRVKFLFHKPCYNPKLVALQTLHQTRTKLKLEKHVTVLMKGNIIYINEKYLGT